MDIFQEFATEKVPIALIVEFLNRDARKSRHYMFLPIFMAFLTVMVALMLVDKIDFTLHGSDFFGQQQNLHELTKRASTTIPNYTTPYNILPSARATPAVEFAEVSDIEEFWSWLRLLTASIYELSGRSHRSQIMPVDLLLVRQMRRQFGPCDHRSESIIDPFTNSTLSTFCYLPEVDTEPSPFGDIPDPLGNASAVGGAPPIRFMPNGWKAAAGIPYVPGRTVNGRFHEMSAATVHYEYSEQCYYGTQNLTQCLTLWDRLQYGEWFDEGTEMVSVDIVSYFPNQKQYIAISFIIDISPSGYFVGEIFSSTFRMYSVTTAAHAFILFGDAVIFAFALCLLMITALEIREDWNISCHRRIPFGFWAILTISLGFLLGFVFIQRVRLWYLSFEDIQRGPTATEIEASARAAFELYVEVDALYIYVYELVSFCFLVSGVKFFYFLQYVRGLNVVTNTLRHSRDSLIGLGLLFASMLFVYSIIGSIIFGQVYYEMRTVPLTATFLARCVVGGELIGYKTFVEYDAASTYIFFGSLYIFFWLLLINLVLGATSSAFLSYDRLQDTDHITEVIKTYFLLTGPMFEHPRHMHDLEDHMMSACVRLASQPLRIPESFWGRVKILLAMRSEKVKACITLTKELSNFRDKDDATVTRQEFAELLPEMSSRRRQTVYQMSLDLLRKQPESNRVAEQKHERIVMELDAIQDMSEGAHSAWMDERVNSTKHQKKIEKLEAKVTELKAKLKERQRTAGGEEPFSFRRESTGTVMRVQSGRRPSVGVSSSDSSSSSESGDSALMSPPDTDLSLSAGKPNPKPAEMALAPAEDALSALVNVKQQQRPRGTTAANVVPNRNRGVTFAGGAKANLPPQRERRATIVPPSPPSKVSQSPVAQAPKRIGPKRRPAVDIDELIAPLLDPPPTTAIGRRVQPKPRGKLSKEELDEELALLCGDPVVPKASANRPPAPPQPKLHHEQQRQAPHPVPSPTQSMGHHGVTITIDPSASLTPSASASIGQPSEATYREASGDFFLNTSFGSPPMLRSPSSECVSPAADSLNVSSGALQRIRSGGSQQGIHVDASGPLGLRLIPPPSAGATRPRRGPALNNVDSDNESGRSSPVIL